MSRMLPTSLAGTDSRNNPGHSGDRVTWRGQEYGVLGFAPGAGRGGAAAVVFDREPHCSEVPDEIAIDLVGGDRPPVRFVIVEGDSDRETTGLQDEV